MATGAPAYCDESSDCPASQRCCSGRTDDGNLTACVTPARCARYWDRPGGFMIPAQEICRNGGSCKGQGLVCIPATRERSVSGGQCVSATARVADCPAEKPWRFWDAETKQAECIPRGPWLREDGVLECDDHADCPGGMCCSSGRGTFCSAAECDPGLAYAGITCRTAKDCGKNEGNVASCIPEERLPPGTGTCGWSRAEPP